MKNLIPAISLAIFALLFARGIYAKFETDITEIDAPVVVELFTSQSCSSCPPADKILSELAQKDNVIALGCHVSYWNHLHWKDTLSNEFCDIRQHGYGAYTGEKRIYTPQMIVNGGKTFIGSRVNELNTALNQTKNTPIMTIKIETITPRIISFTLPKTVSDKYRLWAFGYKQKSQQDIKQGENKGLQHVYANAIGSYTNLGSWDGQSAIHQFEKPNANIDAIAILAQKGGYGPIVAAGKLNF